MLSRLLSRLVWLAIVRRVVWYFQDDLGTHTRSNAPPHLRPRRCRRPRNRLHPRRHLRRCRRLRPLRRPRPRRRLRLRRRPRRCRRPRLATTALAITALAITALATTALATTALAASALATTALAASALATTALATCVLATTALATTALAITALAKGGPSVQFPLLEPRFSTLLMAVAWPRPAPPIKVWRSEEDGRKLLDAATTECGRTRTQSIGLHSWILRAHPPRLQTMRKRFPLLMQPLQPAGRLCGRSEKAVGRPCAHQQRTAVPRARRSS